MQTISRRLVGIAAMRRWREGAAAAYERSHVWDLARRGSDHRKSHFALGELVRAADVAARNRELEVRAESMHMAQSLRQLHVRCMRRDSALRQAKAPSPMLRASSHAVTAAAAAAATAAAAASSVSRATSPAAKTGRRQLQMSSPQGGGAQSSSTPRSDSRELMSWAVQVRFSRVTAQLPHEWQA